MGASLRANAGWFGFGGDSWKEEVLLHDGRTIIVERYQNYGGFHEPGQAGPVHEQRLRFSLPGSKQVFTWAAPYDEYEGRTDLTFLALHFLDGIPYIVTTPYLCIAYSKGGHPSPPYVIFKWKEGT